MRAVVLISGGKDSALALHRVLRQGIKVECLVAMMPHRKDSWMFHSVNIQLTELFAEAASLPLVKAETEGNKETELDDLKRVLDSLDVEAVVSGAVASQYQKGRIEKICTEIGAHSIAPLWNEDPRQLLNEIVALGFEAVISGVYAYGFDLDWLGKQIDEDVIKALSRLHRKYGISLIGEGGEYESLVLDAPFFRKRINLAETEIIRENQSGWLQVKKAFLSEK